MKKIVLLSLVFGLLTTSASATYYQTTTNNCSDAAMMAELDRATATHRAVVTDVTCEYTVPKTFAKAKSVYVPRPRPVARPVIVRRPTVMVVSVEQETCTCDDYCGC